MTFQPKVGNRELVFESLWQVVQYELGYSAYMTKLPIPSHAREEYRKGHADAAAAHNRPPRSVK
jgi:hypothetical protein